MSKLEASSFTRIAVCPNKEYNSFPFSQVRMLIFDAFESGICCALKEALTKINSKRNQFFIECINLLTKIIYLKILKSTFIENIFEYKAAL